jgi:transcriptional regulator with XRE-family HTH domain
MAEIIDNVKVGLFIKGLLKDKQMTQDQLANHLSITKAAVSQNLNGKSAFDIQNLVRIAELFHLTLDDLIAGRRPNQHLDMDSEYVRMMKRGLTDFQRYDIHELNIAHPDVYGRVLMDYLLKDEKDDWITYMVENGVTFALPQHVRYRPLVQRVVLYVLQKKLTSPFPLIEQYVEHVGLFEMQEASDRQLFFALLNDGSHKDLVLRLWSERHVKKTRKSIFFIPYMSQTTSFWIQREAMIHHIIEFHLVDLWKILVDAWLIQRLFYQIEPYFRKLTTHAFLPGMVYLLEKMKAIDKIEAFMSEDVSMAMVFLAQKKQYDAIFLAIEKHLVYDINRLFSKFIPLQDSELLNLFIAKFQRLLSAKKCVALLVEYQHFEVLENHPAFFTHTILSYALDAIKLEKADAITLHRLIQLGAQFQADNANRFTAEKMNRILTKPKKGS